MTTWKTIALTRRTFVGKVMSLLFNMLSMLVITFLPRNKRLLISWLWSPSAVILGAPKIKSVIVSTVSPSICHEVMGLDAMILDFLMLSFKTAFSLSSFTLIKRLCSSSLLSAIRMVQFSSVAQSCLTLCDAMNCSMPGLPVNHQLAEFTKLMSIDLVMPSSHLILCRFLLFLPSIFPSIRVFSNETVLRIR